MTASDQTLRIAYDARSLTSRVMRGWDRYTVGLVREFVRQGLEITLFHEQSKPLHPDHLMSLGCRTLGLPDRSGLCWEQAAVPFALWRHKFDIYHAPAEHGVPLASPCPVVMTVHSATTQSYRRLIDRGLLPGGLSDYLGYEVSPFSHLPSRCYHRLQLVRASHILTPSDFCRDEVIELLRISPDRVTTTPLAAHEQFHRPVSSPETRRAILQRLQVTQPYLLYVGGFEPHKNVSGLLEAFAHVRRRRADLSLVLVGSKFYPEDLARQAEQMGLDRDVVFLVDLTDDLTELYDGAELFMSLSWRETFCLPVLEALSRGLPVIVSSWGAAPEVAAELGRLVDPRDCRAAAQEALDLLANIDRRSFAEKARQAAAQFDWSRTAAKTYQVYLDLTTRKRNAA